MGRLPSRGRDSLHRRLDCAHGPQLLPRRARFPRQVRAWLRGEPARGPAREGGRVRRTSRREDLLRWHRILADQGWIAPAWPQEWGGTGWNVVQRYIFEEECGYAGAPPLIPFGLAMCAPVLIHFGTEAQKKRFLPRIYDGDDFWCQGYSEPGSGSDLASLKTSAVRDGRPLRRQRPEDLDHARPLRRLDLLPGAHRRGATRRSRKASRSC